MGANATKNPSCVWFWDDHENDPALRLVSLAAQGLWMRMQCVAARAKPAGYIVLGLEPCTVDDLPGRLAPLVGVDKETVMDLIRELREAGVFSVTRSRIAYSRRMLRAGNLSEVRARAGRNGAAVTNGRKRDNSGLPQQNDGKDGGKGAASGTRPQSSFFKEPLNPLAGNEGEKGAGLPAVIAGITVGELRTKAAVLVKGGPGSETTARGLGDAVIREMVRHGLLLPEVAQRYGVKVPRTA
ncbi:hypothetical protein [Niveispirillum sp.]|uniref:hypothetical protein n=1 Tax=Niveispirillum sp. TaxID=1917217 RepID=UPI001B44482E|nr:hypothetical protein [Niveispirillum sp.]MBP7336879.1 hypothetical protein [Niveispirillum sp.]